MHGVFSNYKIFYHLFYLFCGIQWHRVYFVHLRLSSFVKTHKNFKDKTTLILALTELKEELVIYLSQKYWATIIYTLI